MSEYNPNDDDPVTHCGSPDEGTWRVMASAYDRNTITLRVQGEPNFISPHHAFLLYQQLAHALRDADVCLDCGTVVRGTCHCENDD